MFSLDADSIAYAVVGHHIAVAVGAGGDQVDTKIELGALPDR
jgi:hypothetical protein